MSGNAGVLPVSAEEMERLGWDRCDIILVTGDAYVDHPSFGTAIIGRYLESLGYRVGIIPQPDTESLSDILRLGIPRLFAGVSSGAMDSMVNHYTSLNRSRSEDPYSEGGRPGRRPDRAVLRYVNLVQRAMPGVPVVIGGIEASMRRVSHYDFWSDRIRKSILLDSKASILVYGMGERAVGEIAATISGGGDLFGISGTATWADAGRLTVQKFEDCLYLPSHEEVAADPRAFMDMTATLERESNPWSGRILVQRADTRAVFVQPPAKPLDTGEMDAVYSLPFTRKPHPSYREPIPAFDMIRDSVTVVRGCSGGCSFCALGLHQGRFLSSRSVGSVISEVVSMVRGEGFRGTVTDLGGPTANLYGLGCGDEDAMRKCRRTSCLWPDICSRFRTDHSQYLRLLSEVSSVKGVKHVFVSSGIRYDVAMRDPEFIRGLVSRHVSGYLKIAPEHFSPRVLRLMRKPPPRLWREFLTKFREESRRAGREQYVEPYLMVAFPGCTQGDMELAAEELREQGMRPERAQIFLPTPMTMATAMYLTGIDPETGGQLEVTRRPSEKRRQLGALPGHTSARRRKHDY
ncbi:MAG: hypothetical protein AVO35_06010 [Candidatus Aegiribacteria sp. MLS_C]|nr:MAG: hypothetical protein AVO35_06010 [Candidatus Aegiribacteria sp. MLS_C]